MSEAVWGSEATKYFYDLTPELILSSVEQIGFRCTGRVLALNSMENRVIEVEIELEDETAVTKASEFFKIAKFYRPGRWSKEQILDEHSFLLELVAADIPVIAPIVYEGETLFKIPDVDLYYAVFPKRGGRNPSELSLDQYEQIGRLLARMHNVGASQESQHRLNLNANTFGSQHLNYIETNNVLPLEIVSDYKQVVESLISNSESLFSKAPVHRIHGDAHMGNLLWGSEGAFWVDFDDMLVGPAVQDLWLLIPGRLSDYEAEFDKLLSGYEQFRDFPYESRKLVEALRAFRMIHFSVWIHKRWEDQSFRKAFVEFGTNGYWYSQLQALQEQLRQIS